MVKSTRKMPNYEKNRSYTRTTKEVLFVGLAATCVHQVTSELLSIVRGELTRNNFLELAIFTVAFFWFCWVVHLSFHVEGKK